MQITQRVLDILKLARRYKFLNRKIIQSALFPQDNDGSVTRDVLRKMIHAGLLRRISNTNEHVINTAPVYIPTESGCCTLTAQTGEMHWILDCPPNSRSIQKFSHYLCVTRLTMIIDEALNQQTSVEMPQLYFEHDLLGDDNDPEARYRLYTVVGKNNRGHNIISNSDFACLIRVGQYARAYHWEYETGADGSPTRVINKKTPGVVGLSQSKKYQQHFPTAQDMRCVAVCPNTPWRESMRNAVRSLKNPEAEQLWLFVTKEDITVESFLHQPIFYTASEGPKPFVKPTPLTSPVEEPQGGAAEAGGTIAGSTAKNSS